MAAMYYGYCMLPDGTYCLAPPPPGIDANAYYNSMPAGMMPAHSASPAPPPPGTTPPPESAVAVPSAPTAAAALPPASAPVSHATPSGFYSTRYVYPAPVNTSVVWYNTCHSWVSCLQLILLAEVEHQVNHLSMYGFLLIVGHLLIPTYQSLLSCDRYQPGR